MKNKYWIALIVAVFLVCLALVVLPIGAPASDYAEVTSDGEVIAVLNLNVPKEFTVTTASGSNTITVKDGKVAVTAADCPDHYCMRQGFRNGGIQIVCLPHKLVISFLGDVDIDGSVG